MTVNNFKKHCLSIIICFAALLPFSPQASASFILEDSLLNQQDSANQQEEYLLYHRARQKYAMGKLYSAQTLYTQSLKANPIYFPSMIGLADIEFKRKRPKKAKEFLNNALQAAPNSTIVQIALGKFHYSSGDYKNAEFRFKKAISIDPDKAAPHAELASMYLLRLKRLKDSENEYNKAITLQPKNIEYYYGLSVALSRQKKTNQAIEVLEKAVNIEPDNPIPVQLKGQLLGGAGKNQKAIQSYNKVLLIKPDHAPAHWALGSIYLAEQQYSKAHKAYDRFISIKPKSSLGFTKKGIVYSLQGNHQNAEKAYLSAVRIDPELSLAYNNLAHGAIAAGSGASKAIKWAKKAVRLEPENPLYMDTLGWLYKNQGQLKLARKILIKAANFNSAPPGVHYHLGVVYSELGEIESAKNSLKKSLSMSDKFEGAKDAHNRLERL